MKTSLLLLLAGLTITSVQSQEITTTDALRYAQQNLNGTARFRAMSGAFGALGGDLSAINVNPAGSAIFTDSQLALTMSNFNTKNEARYFNSVISNTENTFDFNQAGFVFVIDDTNNNWSKLTLAVNYDNTNNFDNTVFAAGTNPSQSLGQYFSGFANQNGGIDVGLLTPQSGESISSLYQYLGEEYGFGSQQAFLGYESFLIDQLADGSYTSMVPDGGNYYQENSVIASGYNGKLAFNVATAYKDKIFLGLNLNSHFTDYTQRSIVYESNANNLQQGVQRFQFSNDLQTYGSGFSFQLGAIAKVTKEFRFGLAYESPTWLTLSDRTTQSLQVVSANNSGELPTANVRPNIINEYAPYRLQTPSKWTGSLAYVFGQTGLISVDYAIRDYSNTKFSPDYDYRDFNNEMSNILTSTGELRIGGEYRIKDFSLRGGYRMEDSPYKNGRTMGDLTSYSAGIGYNFGSTRLDLAYTYAERDFEQPFLTSGITNVAIINGINNNVSLTLLFQL